MDRNSIWVRLVIRQIQGGVMRYSFGVSYRDAALSEKQAKLVSKGAFA